MTELALFRKVTKSQAAGRFVVSEGIAPSTYFLPHVNLPTQWSDDEDDRFEIVIPQGTILSVMADANGDTRVVPANSTGSGVTWGDVQAAYDPQNTGATPTSTAGSVGTVTVAAHSVPIGCAQYHLYRPFDKGTSQGAGWIRFGYVEWPLIEGLNTSLAVGDAVKSDGMGRPVEFTLASDLAYERVGNVLEIEKFATNFDDGLLSYMQLPSDPGALKEVYSLTKPGTYNGKLGIRVNLDVAYVIGAFRVALTLS